MNDRGDKIKQLKEKMNRVEDEVFAHFCEQIGVDNIRLVEIMGGQFQEVLSFETS